jgi:hypothetical protein
MTYNAVRYGVKARSPKRSAQIVDLDFTFFVFVAHFPRENGLSLSSDAIDRLA